MKKLSKHFVIHKETISVLDDKWKMNVRGGNDFELDASNDTGCQGSDRFCGTCNATTCNQIKPS